jgi:hypothetical protein
MAFLELFLAGCLGAYGARFKTATDCNMYNKGLALIVSA